jgi:hypothetical protein
MRFVLGYHLHAICFVVSPSCDFLRDASFFIRDLFWTPCIFSGAPFFNGGLFEPPTFLGVPLFSSEIFSS